jgi:hypothetical protein
MERAGVTGGKLIAVCLSYNAVNPLVAFYNIHERNREAFLSQ